MADAEMPLLPVLAMKLSQLEIENLTHLMFWAFLEVRILGWEGKAQQAADLADAFHNLPVYLYSDEFDWDIQRRFFEAYCKQYRQSEPGFDYVMLLDQIRAGTYRRD